MASRGIRALNTTLSVLAVVAVAGIGLWTLEAPSAASGLLRVTFIDVGQGDAAWLSTPDGWDILIDGGPDEGEGVVLYLQAHGVADIEALIVTHAHEDHFAGLTEVVKRMPVSVAFTNCSDPDDYPDSYRDFLGLLASKAISTTCVLEGDTFAWGTDVSATAVNPPQPPMSGTRSDVNNNSVVLRISYDSVDFLFAGDVESGAEAAILDREPTLEAEILKVPHHGSKTSSSEAFLTEVDPEEAVISVGASNQYGHPDAEALERLWASGATIYRTDNCGTILVTTDGITYWVECEIVYHVYLPLALASRAWNCQGDLYNCDDFESCAQVMSYWHACPGDPSHLDNDHDGQPCESLCR